MTVSLIQSTQAGAANASSCAATYGSNLTNESVLVATAAVYIGAAGALTISDTGGHTWVGAVAEQSASSSQKLRTWYAVNTATNTPTVTIGGASGSYFAVSIAELGGVDNTTVLDATTTVSTGSFSSSQTLTGPSITPGNNGALVYGAMTAEFSGSGNPTFTVGSGFTIVQERETWTTDNQVATEYQVQTTATAVSPAWSVTLPSSFAFAWAAHAVAFKAAPSNPSPSVVTCVANVPTPAIVGDRTVLPTVVTAIAQVSTPNVGWIIWVKEVGAVTNTTAGTSSAITVASGGVPAGDTVVIYGACDNTALSGAATAISVADNSTQAGTENTWTLQTPQALVDPGAAAAGQQGFFVVSKLTRALAAGDTITINYGESTTAKAINAQQFAGPIGVLAGSYAHGSHAASTAPTVTAGTAPNQVGQAVCALVAVEGGTADSFTQDTTNTTGGSWTGLTRRGSGTTTSGSTLNSVYKIVTATGAQTYAPTLGTARDCCSAILVLDRIPAVVPATTVTCVVTPAAPTISTASGTTATPAAVTCVANVPAPTVVIDRTATATVVTVVASVGIPTIQTGSSATATPAAVTCVISVGTPVVAIGRFPVSISGNSRYLVDQTGAPWPMVGDAGWSAITQLTPAEQTTYLDQLQALGFNAVLVNLIENYYSDDPPNNPNGDGPYTGTMFQSSIDEAYWSVVDAFMAKAAARGITVLAVPLYAGGSDSEGVGAEMVAASNAQMQTYGAFLGNRYQAYPNIVWVIGGDRNYPSATLVARWENFITGVGSTADTHLFTGHGRPDTGEVFDAYWEASTGSDPSWLDINDVYTYSTSTVAAVSAAYNASPTRPFYYLEGLYEQEQSATRAQLRQQMWSALVVGGIGHVFGNNPRWHFECPVSLFGYSGTWRQSIGLDTPGTYDDASIQMGTAFGGFLRDHWPALATTAPDTTDTFLTAGESTGATQAAARFSTSHAVVYMPTSREVTFDLTEFSGAGGTVRVRRYDPVSGAFSGLDTTYAASAGNLTLTTVAFGTNSSGSDSDWVLLFEPAIVPAVVTCVVQVPTPTVSTASSTTVTPTVVTCAVTVPSPTIQVGRTATPTTVTVVASVSAPTITVDRTATPTSVTVVASVGAPTVTVDRTATPATVTVIASVGSSTVAIDRTSTPAVVTVVAELPAPAIQAGGSATATPAVVTVVASVPAPSIFTGTSATTTPTVVTVIANVPAPTITTTGNATATPAVVTVVAQVGSIVIGISYTATPTVVTVLALPAPPGVTASATVAAVAVTVLCLVGSPTILGAVSNIPVTAVRLVLGLDRRIRFHPDPRITWRR